MNKDGSGSKDGRIYYTAKPKRRTSDESKYSGKVADRDTYRKATTLYYDPPEDEYDVDDIRVGRGGYSGGGYRGGSGGGHQDGGRKKPYSSLVRNRIILGVVILILVACFVVTSVFAYEVTADPTSLFEQGTVAAASDGQPDTVTYYDEETGEAIEVAVQKSSVDAWAELQAQADTSMMHNVVNVLLIGVDYADERVNNETSYVGKNFNSDVMMVLAINFDENKMDMISVPRDTYAQIANAPSWPYKINFSLTLGGGINDAGFKNTCDSVSWVLGGIPINYYVAVTMPMLKEVVDIVGGVDIENDIAFKIQGRTYEKGMQHLDGQGFLDYCRTRKQAEKSGDDNRVNRQKTAMLALFKTIKTGVGASEIEPLIKSFMENCYTNMTFPQLAALAVFGYDQVDLDSNVTMRSFTGTRDLLFYNNTREFGYVVLNQKKRIEIIKEVYNVEVPVQETYTYDYACWDWAGRMIDNVFPKFEEYAYGGMYQDYTGGYADPTVLPPTPETYVDPLTGELITVDPSTVIPDPTITDPTMTVIDPVTGLPVDTSTGTDYAYYGYSLDMLMAMCRQTYAAGYTIPEGTDTTNNVKANGKALLDMVEACRDMAELYYPDFAWGYDIYADAPMPMKE